MQLRFVKMLIAFSILVICGSQAFADDDYVNSRLSNVLAALQTSSLAAPDLSDGFLNYIETFRFDIENPERSTATQSLTLFLAALNIDQIIDHLGIGDDFPRNYLLDYARVFYDNVFLPLNRGDFYIETTSWWTRAKGGLDAYIIHRSAEARITQESKFLQLFLKDRLYAGAYLIILAKNLLEVQNISSVQAVQFFAWVSAQWPELITETDEGRFNFWGISPLLSLHKDTPHRDIEFWGGQREAQNDKVLLFPREEDWDYGAETIGGLIAYRFYETRPTSMKDIHTGHLCVTAEDFDSGKKYAMQFELPPFTIAEIHAVASRDLSETMDAAPSAPAFTGLLYIRLPRGGEEHTYFGYYYHDPRYDVFPSPEAVEQDALYPFLRPTFYESGECPVPIALEKTFRDPSYRAQVNHNLEFLRTEISKGDKAADKAGVRKKESSGQKKITSSAVKFKQRNFNPPVQSVKPLPGRNVKSFP